MWVKEGRESKQEDRKGLRREGEKTERKGEGENMRGVVHTHTTCRREVKEGGGRK